MKESICRITTRFHLVCFYMSRKSFLVSRIFMAAARLGGHSFNFAVSLPINRAAGRRRIVYSTLIGSSNPDKASLSRSQPLGTKSPTQSQGGELDPPDFTAPTPESLASDRPEIGQRMLGLMVGGSPVMQHLFARMRCTAPHFRLATVEGEPGVGKMLAARTLHKLGPGSAGPFAPFAAAEFLEDALAHWRDARGGLVYLSHIEELSAVQQRELRDFLEYVARERIRVHAASGPFQLIAGSFQPLRRLSASGSFRADLAAHLTAIRFSIPPLRERREDISLLAALFLRRWSDRHSKPLRGFAPGVLARLAAHSWPGNVRDLESVVDAAALETAGQWIRPIDIPRLDWTAPPVPALLPESSGDDPDLDHAILRHVTLVLARVNGNKVRAARLLGISRSTLYRMIEGKHPPTSEL
jgi:DNA-binding NtrC family response regulator